MNRWLILFSGLFIFTSFVWASPDGGMSVGQKQDARAVNVFLHSNALFSQQEAFLYSTTTYTFNDLVVFSYFDDSEFFLFNQDGVKMDSIVLQNNQFYVFSPGMGTYRVEGNKSFTLLIGDPVSRSVLGYYAVDESGSPLSTRLNTYMPVSSYTGEHFIVFAYDDQTEYKIKNLQDSSVIAAGVLNRGEHYQLDGYANTFIGVESNKPVSALSYADQGYFIPADNGTFAGMNFYGFSGVVGGWGNGVVITAYQDSTHYLILNSSSGDTIAQGVVNKGEVYAYSVYEDLYWQVISDQPVTVSNTPYASFSGSYYYLTRQIDESGRGIGTNFYTPVVSGDYNILSYEDNNSVLITAMTMGDTIWAGVLNAGEQYHFSCQTEVYHVTGSTNLAIITSWGGSYGADFVPLNFTVGLPDLAVSSADLRFDPEADTYSQGDPITIKAWIHNQGYQTANDVKVRFYDGDPQGGLPISPVLTADSIAAGDSVQFSYNWTVPEYPEYHNVYVIADQGNSIQESNESNNVSFKAIIANDDLLPPLSTVIEAPVAVDVSETDSLEFTDFTIHLSLFNTGTVTAQNAKATLTLPEGLSVADTSLLTVDWPEIGAQQSADTSWQVHIDSLIDGDAYFYSVLVEADSVTPKRVERMLLINRATGIKTNSPATLIPSGFSMSPNYPNPFGAGSSLRGNAATHFEIQLTRAARIDLDVFNITGMKVAELDHSVKSAGRYQFSFNGKGLSSGVYFIRFRANNNDIAVNKIIFLK